ncbi:MAG: IPTL-CTERM sorting domain-containing protein [Casimicrobiaceae bacterium]
MRQTYDIGMRGKALQLLAGAGFSALLLGITPASAQISLGSAETFGVLAGSAVTNTGATNIVGHVGVSPGTSITGFPPGVVAAPSTLHSADAVAGQAQTDLTAAYNAILGTATLVDMTGTDLGGTTLTPGVYNFASSAQLTGTLTLNALGDPNAVFIFKIGSTLTTASASSVVMINGASSCNLHWQVGSSATLGSGTSFAGNILALASITMTTGASLAGKALARTGAVTMDTNSVAACAAAPIVCPSITVSPASLPSGTMGSLYAQNVVATGGTGPYSYAVSSGTLPPGLSFNAATGAITGTPAASGSFNFTVTAIDSNGCPGSRAYTIVIAAVTCPAITLSPSTLPPGIAGSLYNQTVVATGGAAPYTYTVSSGALPVGLSLNATTGAITGTPAANGSFSFTITAIDSNGCPGSHAYTIVIAAMTCPAITLSPGTLPPGIAGSPYNQTVVAVGGAAPYNYAVSGGALPAGLSLNAASGAITGTPLTTGAFNVTITATDGNGCPGSQAYIMVIAAPAVICPVITIDPAMLPGGIVGTPYSQTVSASGGVAPYTYSLAGTLPNGLSLNAATGAITGTPMGFGTFSFTITATDANGCIAAMASSITITAAVVVAVDPMTAIPTLSEWGLIILMMLTALVAMHGLKRIRA